MRSHRIVIFIAGVLIALIAAAPAAAQSTLLSGYGGPGQGNQAILGATIVKGSGGGGSSGGGSGGATGAGESGSAASGEDGSEPSLIAPNKPAVASSPAGSSGVHAGSNGRSGRSAAPGTSGRHAPGAAGQAARQAPASFYPAAERVPAGQSAGALGLSGADVVYILLAIAVLVSIGLFTKRVGAEAGRPGVGG